MTRGVKCAVENCKYNDDCNCVAKEIMVDNCHCHEAKNTEETECKTFRNK